ncbi:retention in endoplasmic reticulum protein 1 [Ranunculus cassubicifolius]
MEQLRSTILSCFGQNGLQAAQGQSSQASGNNGPEQGSVWPLGVAMRSCSMLRNRMLADPAFLFKVGTEIVIDSCCATFAEVQKRGKDFWAEFELYAADLLVGVVVDIALVGLLAPCVRFGQPSISKGFLGSIQRSSLALPNRVTRGSIPVYPAFVATSVVPCVAVYVTLGADFLYIGKSV